MMGRHSTPMVGASRWPEQALNALDLRVAVRLDFGSN